MPIGNPKWEKNTKQYSRRRREIKPPQPQVRWGEEEEEEEETSQNLKFEKEKD